MFVKFGFILLLELVVGSSEQDTNRILIHFATLYCNGPSSLGYLWAESPVITYLISIYSINQYELPTWLLHLGEKLKSKKFHNEKMNEYVKFFEINQINQIY